VGGFFLNRRLAVKGRSSADPTSPPTSGAPRPLKMRHNTATFRDDFPPHRHIIRRSRHTASPLHNDIAPLRDDVSSPHHVVSLSCDGVEPFGHVVRRHCNAAGRSRHTASILCHKAAARCHDVSTHCDEVSSRCLDFSRCCSNVETLCGGLSSCRPFVAPHRDEMKGSRHTVSPCWSKTAALRRNVSLCCDLLGAQSGILHPSTITSKPPPPPPWRRPPVGPVGGFPYGFASPVVVVALVLALFSTLPAYAAVGASWLSGSGCWAKRSPGRRRSTWPGSVRGREAPAVPLDLLRQLLE
jgi:hypothetical protein